MKLTVIVLCIGLLCSCCATLPAPVDAPPPPVEEAKGDGVGPVVLIVIGVIALIVGGAFASG